MFDVVCSNSIFLREYMYLISSLCLMFIFLIKKKLLSHTFKTGLYSEPTSHEGKLMGLNSPMN